MKIAPPHNQEKGGWGANNDIQRSPVLQSAIQRGGRVWRWRARVFVLILLLMRLLVFVFAM